jgi:hypothetical protein
MFRGGAAASLAMTDRRAFSTIAPRQRKVSKHASARRGARSPRASTASRATIAAIAATPAGGGSADPLERRSSHLAEAQVPTHDPGGGEDTGLGPWVGPETRVDLVLALSPEYEEDLRCSLERTAKAH